MASARFGKAERDGDESSRSITLRSIFCSSTATWRIRFDHRLRPGDVETALTGGAAPACTAPPWKAKGYEFCGAARVKRPARIRKASTRSATIWACAHRREVGPQVKHLSFGNHPWPPMRRSSAGRSRREHRPAAQRLRAGREFLARWRLAAVRRERHGRVARVIAECHRHKIKVVPYFSVHEFIPRRKLLQHEAEWKRSSDQVGTVYHNTTGKGEFGRRCACNPVAGAAQTRHRESYRELGFDGIYYDWSCSCPATTRITIPNCTQDRWRDRPVGVDAPPNRTGRSVDRASLRYDAFDRLENFGDLVVNMEEISGAGKWMRMGEAPIVTVLAESIPRSPCPSYRQDHARERNRTTFRNW